MQGQLIGKEQTNWKISQYLGSGKIYSSTATTCSLEVWSTKPDTWPQLVFRAPAKLAAVADRAVVPPLPVEPHLASASPDSELHPHLFNGT